MPLKSINVPQADDLDRVIALVRCLYNDGNLNSFALLVVRRQVEYYLNAARILGLVDNEFKITLVGISVARSRDPFPIIADQFKKSDVYNEWENWAFTQGMIRIEDGTASNFLSDYFTNTKLPRNQQLTNNSKGTGTILRRAKTLEEWRFRLRRFM